MHHALLEGRSQGKEVIDLVLPRGAVWQQEEKVFFSLKAFKFQGLFIPPALVGCCVPVGQDDGGKGLCCGEKLPEVLKGICVVSCRLVMMRQVAGENPKVEAILVEDACTDKSLPFEGAED